MDNRLTLCTVLVCLWVAFVVYCLFNGSKIIVQTKSIKNVYWITSALTVSFAMYLINGISVWLIVLVIITCLSTALYISIPSGYNDKGIMIRGLCFPYRKIEDMNVEVQNKNCRLNFKYFHRIFYIDSQSYKDLKNCETLFKKEKYQ